MTQEDINKINSNCPTDQGIFFQPSMIPVHIKELVISQGIKQAVIAGNCKSPRIFLSRRYQFQNNRFGIIRHITV